MQPGLYQETTLMIAGDTSKGRHLLVERHHTSDYMTPAPVNRTYVSVYSALHDPEAGAVSWMLSFFTFSHQPESSLHSDASHANCL
jgi:hypothetical protein